MNIKPVQVVKHPQYNSYRIVYYAPDGRRRRLSAGSNELLAQHRAIQFMQWLEAGKDPEAELQKAKEKAQASNVTLREFYPIFMQRHGSKQSKSMQNSYRYSFNTIGRCPGLADIPIGSINRRVMRGFMDARLSQDGVSAATANREMACVSIMLSCAVEWDLLESNPLHGMRRLRESGKREVSLSPEQAAMLLEALPEPMANIVAFAIYTGFRRENILSMQIEQLQFHDLKPTAHVRLTVKGGRHESFPLGTLAVEVVRRAIGKRKSGYVFVNTRTGTRYHSISRSFRCAVQRLGLTTMMDQKTTALRFHDLRHVFATWLHQAGISLDALRPLLGHQDRKTTDRYATFDRMALGKQLEAMPRIRAQEGKSHDPVEVKAACVGKTGTF